MKRKRINRITAVMKEHEVTNAMLAAHLDKKPNTISRWRRNIAQPSLDDLYSTAEYFKCAMAELLVAVSWPDGPSKAEKDVAAKEKKQARKKVIKQRK